MKIRLVLTLVLTILPVGCGEAGSSRTSVKELVGTYATEFQHGSERLTLNSDMTFLQVFNSRHGPITTKGRWTRSNEFLGPTEILLIGEYVSEDEEDEPPDSRPISNYGDVTLIAHREHGRLKLARNEAADWYYDRVR